MDLTREYLCRDNHVLPRINPEHILAVYISFKIEMKAFLVALLLVAVPVLALEATEHDEAVVLDCYAIRLGLPVSFSSLYPHWVARIPRLDAQQQSWIANWNNGDQWIQVSSDTKRQWIGVVTQGRPDAAQWITSYKVEHSNDGVYWDEVDDGYSFSGNSDSNTHVKHWFTTPVKARAIRISPKSWHGWISMRADFIFKC
jgi:hypothetical protein